MAAAAGSRQMFPERQPSSRADVLQLHRWLRAELTRMADAVGGLRRQGDGGTARGGTGAGWAETYGSGEELRDLLSRVVYEIARQESTHCVERARLLLQVWVLHETLCVSGVIEPFKEALSGLQAEVDAARIRLSRVDEEVAEAHAAARLDLDSAVIREETARRRAKEAKAEAERQRARAEAAEAVHADLKTLVTEFLPAFDTYSADAAVRARVTGRTSGRSRDDIFSHGEVAKSVAGIALLEDVRRLLSNPARDHEAEAEEDSLAETGKSSMHTKKRHGASAEAMEAEAWRGTALAMVSDALGGDAAGGEGSSGEGDGRAALVRQVRSLEEQLAESMERGAKASAEAMAMFDELQTARAEGASLRQERRKSVVASKMWGALSLKRDADTKEAAAAAEAEVARLEEEAAQAAAAAAAAKAKPKFPVKSLKSQLPGGFLKLFSTKGCKDILKGKAKAPDVWDLRVTLKMCWELLAYMRETVAPQADRGAAPPQAPEAMYEFLLRKYGLPDIAERKMLQLLLSLRQQAALHRRLSVMAKLCGFGVDMGAPAQGHFLRLFYSITLAPRSWVDEVLEKERDGAELTAAAVAATSGAGGSLTNPRAAAGASARAIFEEAAVWWSLERCALGARAAYRSAGAPPEALGAFLERLEKMSATERRGLTELKKVNMDRVLEAVLDSYKDEAAARSSRAEELFRQHDANGDGVLEFEEFMALVRAVKPGATLPTVLRLFRMCIAKCGGEVIRADEFAAVCEGAELLLGGSVGALGDESENAATTKRLIAQTAALPPTAAEEEFAARERLAHLAALAEALGEELPLRAEAAEAHPDAAALPVEQRQRALAKANAAYAALLHGLGKPHGGDEVLFPKNSDVAEGEGIQVEGEVRGEGGEEGASGEGSSSSGGASGSQDAGGDGSGSARSGGAATAAGFALDEGVSAVEAAERCDAARSALLAALQAPPFAMSKFEAMRAKTELKALEDAVKDGTWRRTTTSASAGRGCRQPTLAYDKT